MGMQEILQGFILITGIAGQCLVAHRNTKGFYFWLACNAAAFAASVANQLYGMAALYVFYSFMCFYSINTWKKLDACRNENTIGLTPKK